MSDSSTIRIITQEEQDAIWNETEECLRDIAITCKTRSGSWTEIGRKADKILWVMSESTDRFLLAGRGVGSLGRPNAALRKANSVASMLTLALRATYCVGKKQEIWSWMRGWLQGYRDVDKAKNKVKTKTAGTGLRVRCDLHVRILESTYHLNRVHRGLLQRWEPLPRLERGLRLQLRTL